MSRPLEIPLLGNQAARGLDSHQSETDLAVTPDKWSRHIPHIRRLYIDEELPLEEVMKIMARDYKFHAGYGTNCSQITCAWSCDEAETWVPAGRKRTKLN